MNAATFLQDEVVVELAGVLAGPLVGRFFAEHGAKVTKVENPHAGGDVTRGWYTKDENPSGISAYYASVNQGKESVMLDLKSDDGKDDLERMLQKATILLTNFRPVDFERFNLNFGAIRSRFPKLIIGQIDGFGRDNNRPAYDMVLQAESGFLSMSGTEDGTLVKMPVALIDVLAGQQLKSGILMAMLNRERTGKGALVRISLLDAAISALMNQSAAYLKTGKNPLPMGTLHPSIAPYGECFEASDGKKFILAVGSDAQFDALLQLIEFNEIRELNLYRSNKQRVDNRTELGSLLGSCFKSHSRDQWMKLFLTKGIPAGAIYTLEEVFSFKDSTSLIVKNIQEGEELISVKTTPLFFEE